MPQDTRAQLLDTAETLFAERGFYGASIAAIADELGLTKQALLHHFGTKEKLYGEVLRRISDRFDAIRTASEDSSQSGAIRLKAFLLGLLEASVHNPQQTRVLMRELLDNKRRADTAGTWYLKPFLESLISMVNDVPSWKDASPAETLALVYQLLGAINYFSVSAPTLTGIFGEAAYLDLTAAYPRQFERLIEQALANRA